MNFTVYNSSAGSGKTFTLVSEYLSIALSDQQRFRNILAITFTNKAANEMKQRILTALREIANQDKYVGSASVKYLLPLLVSKTGIDARELANRAENVLTSILHNYSEFAISTIDSFVHRVLKNFSFDLKIPLNFDVELDTDSLLQKAIDILISRIGYDSKLTEYLINFTKSKTDDEKSWSIELDLFDVAKMLLSEDGQSHIQQLKNLSLEDFSKILKALIKFTRDFEKQVSAIAAEANSLILNNTIQTSSFYQGTRGIASYFKNLSEGNIDKINPNTYVKQTIDDDKWYSGKATEHDKNQIYGIKHGLTESFHKIMDINETQYRRYLTFQEILKNIYPLAILNEIEKIIKEYKEENDLLPISEFNQRIAEIVLNEPVPFIYERIGERYKHFLIDEFQDTSFLQWNNFLPLIDNSLSEGNFNLIVGDGKQAIYRWRNGEVEQFTNLPAIHNRADDPVLIQREEALERNFELKKLTTNYRSKQTIVDFNNSFFTFVSQHLEDSFRKIYRDVEQQIINTNEGGFIEIQLFDKEDQEITFDEFNTLQILNIVNDVQNNGYELKDIAILCRSNNQANGIATFLLKENINVVSSESLLVSSSPDVRLLIAVVGLIVDRNADVPKLEILNWLVDNKKVDKNLHQLIKELKVGSNYATKEENPSKHFFTYLSGLGFELQLHKLLSQSTYEIIEEIARKFKLLSKPNPYILFLMEAILTESSKDVFDVSDLLVWWDSNKNKLSIVVPEGLNAVKVMTIHKAKGLEFPVVIFPYATGKHTMTKDKLWVNYTDEDLEGLSSALVNTSKSLENTIFESSYLDEKNKSLLDLINLLYVILTRPSDQLYIISQKPPAKQSETISIPALLKDYLESQNLWQDDQLTFTLGEKATFQNKTKDDEKSIILKRIISESWIDKIRLSLRAPRQWDIEKPGEVAEMGTLIHTLLSEISTFDDLDKTLQKYKDNGTLTEDEKLNLGLDLEKFIGDERVLPYFSSHSNILNEPEIINPDGHVLRPDRLLFSKDKIIVIDFKTGQHTTRHEDQVRNYVKTLEKMDSRPVMGILLYVYGNNPVINVMD